MFSNVQYQISEPLKVLLIMSKERQLLEGVFTDRDLNASIGRKLITTPLDANNDIMKIDKLACITEMVLRYRPPLGSYLAFRLCLNIFFRTCTS